MFNDTDVNATGSVDVNIKYKLYIIVPIIWSTIIFLGLLGERKEIQLNLFNSLAIKIVIL